MQNPWSLLRILPSLMPKYCDHVTNRFPTIELYFPQHRVLSRPTGHRYPKLVLRPTFPGYIFARPDFSIGEHNLLTRNVPARVFFVKFGPDIEFIPERVIIELKKLENEDLLRPKAERMRALAPGQRVLFRVETSDLIGIIHRIYQNKVTIDTSHTRVTVPIDIVNPA